MSIPYSDWLQDLYESEPWGAIAYYHRRAIVRHRLTRPEACPICGRTPVLMFNISGFYRDDDKDYEFMCPQCHADKVRPFRTYVRRGDKLKPWSELTRQGKMFRIRRDLPVPDRCPYCDRTLLELFSMSGTWPEDIEDYVWVCRSHAVELADLLHEKPAPLEPADPALFPWWTNGNSMAGSFLGHSILNKSCAMGRFYHILKKGSRKGVQ